MSKLSLRMMAVLTLFASGMSVENVVRRVKARVPAAEVPDVDVFVRSEKKLVKMAIGAGGGLASAEVVMQPQGSNRTDAAPSVTKKGEKEADAHSVDIPAPKAFDDVLTSYGRFAPTTARTNDGNGRFGGDDVQSSRTAECPKEHNQGHDAIFHQAPHPSWDSDVWGACVPDGLPDRMYEKSVLIDGKGSSLRSSVNSKLASEQCVHVVAMGGSGTVGAFVGSPKSHIPPTGSPGGVALAWPTKLAEWLNRKFPCKGIPSGGNEFHSGLHIVTNLGASGKGSNWWADKILEWKSDHRHPIRQSDLIIIEAASNDMNEALSDFLHTNESSTTIKMYTELVARQLLQLPNTPELVWAELLWRGSTGESIEQHQEVLSYYNQCRNLAQISAFHAFSVLTDGKLNTSQNQWLEAYYYWDPFHPSALGHRLAAQLVGHSISMTDSSISLLGSVEARGHSITNVVPAAVSDAEFKDEEQAIDQDQAKLLEQRMTYRLMTTSGVNLPPAKWTTPEMDNAYLHGKETSFALSDPELAKPHLIDQVGFEFKEDVKGKPGLIAENIGSYVLFGAKLPDLGNARHKVMVTVGLLKSYEKMGMVKLSYQTTPSRNGQCSDKHLFVEENSAHASIDCQWENKVSVYDAVRGQVKAEAHHECLLIRAEVQKSQRTQNKIKLLRLVALVI